MDNTRPIEIFRLGEHRDRSGKAVSFSQADAETLIANYDPATDPAPLVIGHPKLTDRALGWVDKLRLDGDVLVADVRDIPAEFAESDEARGFRRVSSSFYLPGEAASPNPAGYYLRHVGLLGAHAPSVKGLAAVEFADAGANLTEIETEFSTPSLGGGAATRAGGSAASPDKGASMPDPATNTATNTADFAERERALSAREQELKEREQALDKRDADAVHRGHVDFAEQLVKDAKLLKPGAPLVVGVLDALHTAAQVDGDGATVEFAETEGGAAITLDPAAAFRKLFEGAQPFVEFGEVAGADKTPPKVAVSMPAPAGHDIDQDGAALHAKALDLQKADPKLSYADAAIRAEGELAGTRPASA
ncbi:hypothetical protein B5C34_05250 [Pacificimonas flava]|uniref:Peptidase n=2 Tax=Pacificimonas TaxID=1960290 RepID=A0A219B578_9SPHN|nr:MULTISPECIES: hypothetical protein [Pacificimonas]MBZ6377375.1 hypothetical protein [Pacificimonas aurantium]OWV32918.1 hypothetical protein B5C34_05250 [Pacificimonas flava]